MKGLWLDLVDRLAQREDGTTLALFRIAAGLTVFGELFLTWLRGADILLWRARSDGGYHDLVATSHWLTRWIGTDGGTVSIVFWVTLLASLLVAVGLGTRVAAAVTLVGVQVLFGLSVAAGGGHDRMFQISLFFLILANSDATLSVRCWLTDRRWTSDALVPAWPRFVITWNLALIYVSAGVVKLSAEWLPAGNFRAVYNMMLMPYWTRADYSAWMATLFPLTQLGTAVTVLWEMSWFAVPCWLLLRSRPRTGRWARLAEVDVRSGYVLIGVIMHGTLWLFANLGPFTPITWSWYLVLYRPDEFRALAQRVTGLAGRARGSGLLP